VIGIAKKLEEIYFPGDSVPIYLDKKSESLKLLQQLRDEAHRFGIAFHRQKRSENFAVSELENIKGIGRETSRKLLTKFKSVKNLQEVPFDKLKNEIGNSKALIIREYFAQHSFYRPEEI
jgi:excinuclease ABC subunit C